MTLRQGHWLNSHRPLYAIVGYILVSHTELHIICNIFSSYDMLSFLSFEFISLIELHFRVEKPSPLLSFIEAFEISLQQNASSVDDTSPISLSSPYLFSRLHISLQSFISHMTPSQARCSLLRYAVASASRHTRIPFSRHIFQNEFLCRENTQRHTFLSLLRHAALGFWFSQRSIL